MIIGYGEDALTYWVLSTRLPAVLAELHDPTPAEQALVFFRPSFGRRATRTYAPAETTRTAIVASRKRAEFGEFDAIIGTPAGVYLIEAKWHRSGEIDGDAITLRSEQLARHAVFRTYLELWRRREPRPTSWIDFSGAAGEFESAHPTVRFAPARSTLADNLEFVLRILAPCGEPIRDVLLLAGPASYVGPSSEQSGAFHVVSVAFDSIGPGGFIVLDGAASGLHAVAPLSGSTFPPPARV